MTRHRVAFIILFLAVSLGKKEIFVSAGDFNAEGETDKTSASRSSVIDPEIEFLRHEEEVEVQSSQRQDRAISGR